MKTRRSVLQATAGLAAAVPFLEAQDHSQHGFLQIEKPAPKVVRFFSKQEMSLLEQLVEQIIPRSDTPGAADAKIHYFVDFQAHTNAKLGAQLKKDLAWVKKQGFGKGDAAKQIALLTDWSKTKGTEPYRVFKQLKDLTIDGYYGTKEGLTQELGWNANTFLREFKGCTHPEHGA
jgi:Gluconate 2-dehydrogenase subunit 3